MERMLDPSAPPSDVPLSRRTAAESLPAVVPPPLGRVLVVAPHPDDETFGAGGTIHDLARLGYGVTVVVVTDGAASHAGLPELAAIRRREALHAMKALGVSAAPQFLDLPDGHVSDHREALAARLRSLADDCALIIAPRSGDGHPDHEATAEAVIEAIMGVPEDRRPALWRYAIWAWQWEGVVDADLVGAATWKVSKPGRIQRSQAVAAYCSQTVGVNAGRTTTEDPIVSAAMIADIECADEVFWC